MHTIRILFSAAAALLLACPSAPAADADEQKQHHEASFVTRLLVYPALLADGKKHPLPAEIVRRPVAAIGCIPFGAMEGAAGTAFVCDFFGIGRLPRIPLEAAGAAAGAVALPVQVLVTGYAG